MNSQSENILKYLKAGNTITPLEALNLFNCFRLGARCWDLRKQGFDIRTKLIRTESNKTVAQYRLNVPGKQIELF